MGNYNITTKLETDCINIYVIHKTTKYETKLYYSDKCIIWDVIDKDKIKDLNELYKYINEKLEVNNKDLYKRLTKTYDINNIDDKLSIQIYESEKISLDLELNKMSKITYISYMIV